MKNTKVYFESMVTKGRKLAARKLKDVRGEAGQTAVEKLSSKSASLLTARGQSSGIAVASEILEIYEQSTDDEKQAYFQFLLTEFGRDKDTLIKICADYSEQPDHNNLKALTTIMEPQRQDLFKRINMAPGGTNGLVKMRADLLKFLKESPELKPVDLDFLLLFKTWFNRGFLTMEPINWSSPAVILERLVAYEAVHEITSWVDLKRRLDPSDRLCYAFFHPNLANNPLIFVEVALCEDIPVSIQDILSSKRDIVKDSKLKAAAFYSINNCHAGLKGIYFGNFLIKQVVENLRVAHPKVKKFVTLSPIPGLTGWLGAEDRAAKHNISEADMQKLQTSDWFEDKDYTEKMRAPLRSAALAYLLDRQEGSHRLHDSVARFHLGNGARIENIQWLADTSQRGLDNSYAMMVNYLYEPDHIEDNHEAFAVRHEVAVSGAMKTLKKQSSN